MKELEEYLDSKIGLTNNKNLQVLHRFFTQAQLNNLMNRTISIVGTNGKTSTANFIYKLLNNEMTKVLMFTSPHLLNFSERIQSKNEINFDYLSKIVQDFESENDINLGYFETLFLIACKAFLDNEMDYFICEAGIGGMLDTTSIIQSKNVVITNIGRDHQDLLGYTAHGVLDQKIFVSNNIDNLFVGDISDELVKVIENNYKHTKSKHFLKDFVDGKSKDLTSNQINYLLASLIVNFLISSSTGKITLDFNKEFVEGRFEIINRNPLKILDGAHNIDGFIRTIEDYEKGELYNFKTRSSQKFDFPSSNVLCYNLNSKARICIRPSGTEPKIKFYIMISENMGTLEEKKKSAENRIEKILEFIKNQAELA